MKNKMKKDKIPFTQIPNELIVDEISPGAKSVYMYMQSKPNDWTFYNKEIMKSLNIRTSSTLSHYFKELLTNGWISRKRKYSGGKISGGFDYTVHFSRKNLNVEKTYIKKKPILRKNLHHTNTDLITNTDKDTNTNKEGKIKDFPILRKIVKDFIKYQKNKFGKAINNTETDIKNGINTLDKLIRIDGFDINEIKTTLHFALKNDFWHDKVLSISGLRKKRKGSTKFQKIYISAGKDMQKKINENKQNKISEEIGI